MFSKQSPAHTANKCSRTFTPRPTCLALLHLSQDQNSRLHIVVKPWFTKPAVKPPLTPHTQGMGIQCPFITRHLFRAGAVQSSLTKGVAIVCCSHLGFALQPCLQLRPDNELSSSINTSSMALLSSLQESSSSKTSNSQNSEPKPANKDCFTSRFPAFRNNMKCPWKTLNRVFQGPDPGTAFAPLGLSTPGTRHREQQVPVAGRTHTANSCCWQCSNSNKCIILTRYY